MAMSPKFLRPRATGFNPKSISGLSLWLDASDSSTITLNGSNVSEWRDKSGAGAPAAAQSTAASQPAYNASGVNGRGSVDFDSTESLVFGSSTASFNYLHNATGATIFCVWKPDAASNPDAIRYLLNNTNNSSANTGISLFFDDRSSVSRNNRIFISINRGASGAATSTVTTNNDFVVAANAYFVFSVVADNANATAGSRLFLYQNGTSSGVTNTLTNAAATGNASLNMTIGNFGGGGSPASIAEMLFYQGVLSAAQRQTVERYLGKKYGITVA
jgi:hypothetical protein